MCPLRLVLIALLVAALALVVVVMVRARRGEVDRLGLWIAGLGVLTAGLLGSLGLVTCVECDPGRLDVLSPVAGEVVDVVAEGSSARLMVEGTSQNIADCSGHEVVTLVHPLDPPAPRFWLSEAGPVAPDGRWSATVFVGSDTTPIADGQGFEVLAVATDQDPTSLAASVGGTDDLDPTVRSTAVAFTVSITPEPQVSMDLPDPGEPVPAEPTETAGVAALAIGGTVADIPDGNSVALLVHAVDPAAAGWFPMGPAIVDADGTWSATAFVGSEAVPAGDGHRFEVMAIVTDRDLGTLNQPIPDPLALHPAAVAAAAPIVVSLVDRPLEDAASDDSETLTTVQPSRSATAASSSTVATPPRPLIVVEAEDGTGDGQEQDRDAASAGRTIWLTAGQAHALPLELSSPGTYMLGIAYSNDGGSETIRVEVDGSPVGRIDTEDTRPAGADPGDGWNMFRLEERVGVASLESGTHGISVSLTTADEHGAEIDYVLLSLVD